MSTERTQTALSLLLRTLEEARKAGFRDYGALIDAELIRLRGSLAELGAIDDLNHDDSAPLDRSRLNFQFGNATLEVDGGHWTLRQRGEKTRKYLSAPAQAPEKATPVGPDAEQSEAQQPLHTIKIQLAYVHLHPSFGRQARPLFRLANELTGAETRRSPPDEGHVPSYNYVRRARMRPGAYHFSFQEMILEGLALKPEKNPTNWQPDVLLED